MNYAGIYEKVIGAHAFLPYHFGKGRALPPLRVQLELTGRCNLNCSFCYQGESYKAGENELTFEETVGIIRQVPARSLLTLSGGEPFLKKGIVDILKHAIPRHYCNIITNGTLLSEDICRLLVERRLLLLNISIDAAGTLHDRLRGMPGTFERVKNNITFLQGYKRSRKARFPLIDIKAVISTENLSGLEDLYRLCVELDADFLTLSLPKNNDIQFNGTKLYHELDNEIFYRNYTDKCDIPLGELSSALEAVHRIRARTAIRYYPRLDDYRSLISYLGRSGRNTGFRLLPCLEPWSGFQINAKGEVYPCLAYYAGDARKDSISDIWNSGRLTAFRKKLKESRLFPACSGCCYLKIRREK